MRKIYILISFLTFVTIFVASYLATTVAQNAPDAPSGITTVIRGAVYYRTLGCPNVDLDCQHRDADKIWLYRFGDEEPLAVSPRFYLPQPSNPYTWIYTITVPNKEGIAGWYRAIPEIQLASGPGSATPSPFIFYFNGGTVPEDEDFCVNYCVDQQ